MSWYALPVNRGVTHAAHVRARSGAALHAESDDATRELVDDHENPIAPQHDGLASKEIHASEAVSGVADARQPRGSGSAWGGTIVFRQHPVHHVLMDVDAECLGDDVRNPRAAEPWITRVELDDGLDECVAPTLWSGLLGAGRR